MSFKKAVADVMKGGKYDKKKAAAIVADVSRNASPEAKAKNPKLNKVKGKPAPKKAPAKKAPAKKKQEK